MASTFGMVFLASIPILIQLYIERNCEEDKIKVFPNNPKDLNLPQKESYDFIIGTKSIGFQTKSSRGH
jgi:hypothetical protein